MCYFFLRWEEKIRSSVSTWPMSTLSVWNYLRINRILLLVFPWRSIMWLSWVKTDEKVVLLRGVLVLWQLRKRENQVMKKMNLLIIQQCNRESIFKIGWQQAVQTAKPDIFLYHSFKGLERCTQCLLSWFYVCLEAFS